MKNQAPSASSSLAFLQGGGEMGALTREFDWAATPLGPPDQWPSALRTTIGILLHSRFPMFLFWGPEHICFYNDAYRPSLGNEGKHPMALGSRGADVWPEIWPIIKPLIDEVLTGGEGTWSENQLLPIYRNGRLEDVYWTFSYSPVFDDRGERAGVFVTCTETTGEINSRTALIESEQRIQNLVRDANVGFIVLSGKELEVTVVNEAYCRIIGHTVQGTLHRPIFDVIPEAEAFFRPIIEGVMKSGEQHNLAEAPFSVSDEEGHLLEGFIDVIYQPYRETDGSISGVMIVVQDITESVRGRRQLEASRQVLDLAVEAGHSGIFSIALKTGIATLSPKLVKWFGASADTVPALEIISKVYPADQSILETVFEQAVAGTGNGRHDVIFRVPDPASGKVRTLRSLGQVYRDDGHSHVSGIIQNVTREYSERRRLERSEARFRSLIEESPVGTCLYVGRELRIEVANDTILGYWGKGPGVIGKTLLQALPEVADQPFPGLLQQVFETGITYEEKAAPAGLVVNGIRSTYYFDVTYKPLFDESGVVYAILDMAIDVTGQVHAQMALAESEAKLRDIVHTAPAAMGLFVGRDLVIENPNQAFIDIVGKGWGVVGKPLREAMPELVAEGQPFLQILDDVYTSGVPFHSPGSMVKIVQNGVLTERYYNITYTPVRSADDDTVYAILDIAIDVTDQVLAQQRAEAAESRLKGAIELAELATWSVEAATGNVSFSKRIKEWFGFTSELPIELAFESIHPDDRSRIEKAIGAALSDPVHGTFDEEYRIVNVADGQQRIIHAQAEMYYDGSGRPIELRGSASNITVQRELQLALEAEVSKKTKELERSVREIGKANRELSEANARLQRSNEELAQYAYVTSHDLQEPLRKIRVFSSMLTERDDLPNGVRATLGKIQGSSERMTQLIRDLLAFSRLLQSDALIQPLSLAAIVEAVSEDFELLIEEKGVRIEVAELPVLEAVPLQMNQLFNNLLGNAIKFTSPGREPLIRFSSERASVDDIVSHVQEPLFGTAYYHIVVRDNGIGFDPQYMEQIFEVFRRLHGPEEFAGTGIGLALCRRIVRNHRGEIWAEGAAGEGAAFHILLPEKQPPRS